MKFSTASRRRTLERLPWFVAGQGEYFVHLVYIVKPDNTLER